MAGISTQKPGYVVEDVGGQSAAEELFRSGYPRSRHNVPLTHTGTHVGTHVDLHAVNDAYKESYNDLCKYALSILHSREPAQDCVHQAFTGTFATVKSGGQIEDLKPFLITCVRNNCLNYMRKSKRESAYSFEPDSVLDGEIDTGNERSAAKSVEMSGRWKKVKNAVDDLPSSQRFALLMAEFEGFSYDEIADRMHRSNNSVRQLICRAREKVRSATDGGSDWATIPAPAIEIDRMLVQGHMDLNPSVFDRIQMKTSQLQAWVGSVFQSGADSVLHPVASVATGAAVVALATASPAEPVTGDAGPVAGGFQSAPNLVFQPGNFGGSQSDRAATKSVVDLPEQGDDIGMPGRRPVAIWDPRANEGGHPGPVVPGGGQCEGKKPGDRGRCGDGKPDNAGGGEGAHGDDLEDPDSGSNGEETALTKNPRLTVSGCPAQKSLSKVSACTFSISKVVKVGTKGTFTTTQSPIYKGTSTATPKVIANVNTTNEKPVGEFSVTSVTVEEDEPSLTMDSEVANIDISVSKDDQITSSAVTQTEINSDIKSADVKTAVLPEK